jgi:SAM-dependent methyltransferase
MNVDKLTAGLLQEYVNSHTSKNNNEHIELEVRFDKISKDAFINTHKQLLSQGFNARLEQSINTISSNVFERSSKALPHGTQYIRHMEFESGKKIKDEYSMKIPIRDVRVRGYIDHKIALSKESQSKTFTVSRDALLRFKVRIEFTHADFPNWRIDLTAARSAQLNEVGADLPKLRDALFITTPAMTAKNLPEVLDFADIDQFEIEIEHIGEPGNLTTELINNAITRIYETIHPNYQSELMFQNEIYHVATKIIKNEKIHHLFKSRYGLKRLTNQAMAIMKTTYKDIFPPIGYYLTEKADGLRCVVSIVGGRCRLIADKLYEFGEVDVAANASITIADAELLRGDTSGDSGVMKLMLFDVMWYDNNDLTEKPFSERVDYMADTAKLISKFIPCAPKEFIVLDQSNMQDAFTAVWEAKHPYDIDGLIVTSPDDNYHETKNYKWKPPQQNTIDFLAIKCPKSMLGTPPYIKKPKHTLHLLFVGIDSNMQRRLGISLLPEYKQLFPDIDLATANQYPIQFATSDYPYAYLYYHPDNTESVDGKIVELGKVIKDPKQPQVNSPWLLVHIREDRSHEQQYYGNNYKIADIIWQNFIAPFSFEDLWELNAGYFRTIKDDSYQAFTAFHSYIKSRLTKQYFENKAWVADLASGRGADLNRYQNVGVRNTIFIDSDRVALTELIQRKYSLIEDGRSRRGIHHTRDTPAMVIHVLVGDLSSPADQLKKEIEVFNAPKNKVDGIAMHFAIHYLCDTVPHIRNLLTLVKDILNPGGVFVFTTMHGERVFDKLKNYSNNETWKLDENNTLKFAIRKKYSGEKLSEASQMVSVKLPFSNGEFYDEPLANIATITSHAEDLGFKVEANETFESMLKDFERNNRAMYQRLSDVDKEYSALHQYVVLRLM